MRSTVRDIIVNAMAEARLVSRNQPIPGNLFIDAFSLLKKRLDQYSNTNYLSFIRKEVNFEANKNEMILGTYSFKDEYELGVNFWFLVDDDTSVLPDATEELSNMLARAWTKGSNVVYRVGRTGETTYAWIRHEYPTYEAAVASLSTIFEVLPDIEVENIQEVVRVYVGNFDKWDDLNFVAYEDFYDYSNGYVYSVLPIDDEHVKLFLKNAFKNVKVIYNEAFDFGPDDELNIPRQFISLFTSALVYDLACQFPRLGDTTVALLKQRLDELEENVRRSSSVNKFIGRDIECSRVYSWNDFISGKFLMG